MPCTVDSCDGAHKARGLCDMHYRRLRRTGVTEPRSPVHSFWAKVVVGGPDECWPWCGRRSSTGYGMFRGEKAHRVGARLAGMDIDGWFVLHSCDNPLCVNPAHLRPGTHAENMRDAVERFRMPRGERQWASKLREGDIPEVLRLSAEGLTYREIGDRFGVTKYTIYYVVNRKTWRHVADTHEMEAAG